MMFRPQRDSFRLCLYFPDLILKSDLLTWLSTSICYKTTLGLWVQSDEERPLRWHFSWLAVDMYQLLVSYGVGNLAKIVLAAQWIANAGADRKGLKFMPFLWFLEVPGWTFQVQRMKAALLFFKSFVINFLVDKPIKDYLLRSKNKKLRKVFCLHTLWAGLQL